MENRGKRIRNEKLRVKKKLGLLRSTWKYLKDVFSNQNLLPEIITKNFKLIYEL